MHKREIVVSFVSLIALQTVGHLPIPNERIPPNVATIKRFLKVYEQLASSQQISGVLAAVTQWHHVTSPWSRDITCLHHGLGSESTLKPLHTGPTNDT